jgi:hypothetical protein
VVKGTDIWSTCELCGGAGFEFTEEVGMINMTGSRLGKVGGADEEGLGGEVFKWGYAWVLDGLGGDGDMVGGYSGGEDLPLEGRSVGDTRGGGFLDGNVLEFKVGGVDVVLSLPKGTLLCEVGVVGDGSESCLGKYSTK